MKQTIATTVAQGERLLACGIDPKSADMMWRDTMTDCYLEVLTSRWTDRLRNLGYSPAWSFSRLLALLPNRIAAPCPGLRDEEDATPPVKELSFGSHFSGGPYIVDGEDLGFPRRYCIQYTTIHFLPADHPIMPFSPMTVYLYNEDDTPLIFADENPVEACVKAIEWLTKEGYRLNQIEE